MIILIRVRQAGFMLGMCRQYLLFIFSTTMQTPSRLVQ
jgi:hypothetical protein